MIASSSDLIKFATPFFIVIGIRLLSNYFKKRYPATVVASQNAEMSKSSYIFWPALGLVMMFSVAGLVAFAIAYCVHAFNRLMSLSHGPSNFLLTPTWAWWFLYAMFGALSFSYFPSLQIIRRTMGGKKFAAYMQRGSRVSGYDGTRAMRFLALVIMVPYTAFFVPSLGCHTRFSESEIGIQRYAEITERKYSYSQVRSIALVQGYKLRSGEFQNDPRLVVDFEDGRRWTSREGFRDSEEPNKQLISFLEFRTGKHVQSATLENDLHP
jgi:hypothetical protein